MVLIPVKHVDLKSEVFMQTTNDLVTEFNNVIAELNSKFEGCVKAELSLFKAGGYVFFYKLTRVGRNLPRKDKKLVIQKLFDLRNKIRSSIETINSR